MPAVPGLIAHHDRVAAEHVDAFACAASMLTLARTWRVSSEFADSHAGRFHDGRETARRIGLTNEASPQTFGAAADAPAPPYP